MWDYCEIVRLTLGNYRTGMETVRRLYKYKDSGDVQPYYSFTCCTGKFAWKFYDLFNLLGKVSGKLGTKLSLHFACNGI